MRASRRGGAARVSKQTPQETGRGRGYLRLGRSVIIRPCRAARKDGTERQPWKTAHECPRPHPRQHIRPHPRSPAPTQVRRSATTAGSRRPSPISRRTVMTRRRSTRSARAPRRCISATETPPAFHFQRMFTRWAGVSPKRFARYLSLEQARAALRGDDASCLDAAFDAGLSGPGRLHDLFVTIEAMTPGEFRRAAPGWRSGTASRRACSARSLSPPTPRGICHIAFADDRMAALDRLRAAHPAARLAATGAGPQAEALHAALDRAGRQRRRSGFIFTARNSR